MTSPHPHLVHPQTRTSPYADIHDPTGLILEFCASRPTHTISTRDGVANDSMQFDLRTTIRWEPLFALNILFRHVRRYVLDVGTLQLMHSQGVSHISRTFGLSVTAFR